MTYLQPPRWVVPVSPQWRVHHTGAGKGSGGWCSGMPLCHCMWYCECKWMLSAHHGLVYHATPDGYWSLCLGYQRWDGHSGRSEMMNEITMNGVWRREIEICPTSLHPCRKINYFDVRTCINSSSPSGLKCQSTVARADTSSLRLQEMQPSRNPSPTTASLMESTSAHPPWHWDTESEEHNDMKEGILKMKQKFNEIWDGGKKTLKVEISCVTQFSQCNFRIDSSCLKVDLECG